MYKVTCLYNGTTYVLHDPESEVLRIYDDEVETEDSKPGSFKFSVSFDHPYVSKIVGLSSDIRVYDGSEEIFRGRPVDDGEDLYRTRTFQCEGELAFLYDSIQPRRELHNISPLEFFTLMLEEHNAQVQGQGPIDKTFRVGVVAVTDSNNSLYRYTNRETTYDDIIDKIVNRLGGHLRVRVSGNYRYLDVLDDADTVSDQPIQLGENLLTYARDTNYTQIATACIPLGASLEETEIDALDAYLTVESVNNDSEVIQINSAVNRFGFICKVVNFDDITVPANLLSAGQEWLADEQYANMVLDLTAVDLHTLGYNVQPIRVNSQVRFVSSLHGMDRYFDVSKRTYHLTQPEADTVTFGSAMKQSYTSVASKTVSAVKKHAEDTRRNIDAVIAKERENVSNLLNQATHGYVVLDPNDGPSRILIMDSNVFNDGVPAANKIWKWDMNGLGYSKTGINGPWGVAITMNGAISADFIVTGTLLASLIKAGRLQDFNNKNFWDMETGEFSLAATATVGGKTVSTIAEDKADAAVNAQTQQTIFNKLTNNGQTQGIYLSNGKVYINGTYIQTGTITIKKGTKTTFSANADTGVVNIVADSFSLSNGDTIASIAEDKASAAVNAQTQQTIFNKLTNNGQTQGIYLSGGKVYINAAYIATGTLADAGNNTTFNLSTGTLTMKKGSINIGDGTFKVDTNGNLTAKSATIEGTIKAGSSSGYWVKLSSTGEMQGGYGSSKYGYIDFSAETVYTPTGQEYNGVQIQGGVLRISTYMIAVARSTSTSTTATTGANGTLDYISAIEDNGDGTITWWESSIRFINGIMVSQL